MSGHDCAMWRAEGIGCAKCNPIAREIEVRSHLEDVLREEIAYEQIRLDTGTGPLGYGNVHLYALNRLKQILRALEDV